VGAAGSGAEAVTPGVEVPVVGVACRAADRVVGAAATDEVAKGRTYETT